MQPSCRVRLNHALMELLFLALADGRYEFKDVTVTA